MDNIRAVHQVYLDAGSIPVQNDWDPMTDDTQVQNKHSRSAFDIHKGSDLILNIFDMLYIFLNKAKWVL